MHKSRQCNGKVRHRSKAAATLAFNALNNAGLNVYKCPHCHGWHLGNSFHTWNVQARIDQLLNHHSKRSQT